MDGLSICNRTGAVKNLMVTLHQHYENKTVTIDRNDHQPRNRKPY